MKETRTLAAEAYAAKHAKAMELIEAIQQKIEDMPAPSTLTHWGHVGDLSEIVRMLEAVSERL